MNQKGAALNFFFPERTFHPLIIMLLAEIEVKRETQRILALLLRYRINLQYFQK